MNHWKTNHGYEIVQVLSGRSNAYLILKDDNVFLVDTGKASAFVKLSENIALLSIKLERVSALILTHTHFDHCQSAHKIQENSNCKVIVSAKAAPFIKNGYTTLPNGTFVITKISARLGGLIGERKFGYKPFQADILVEGQYNLDTGIKVIETAGHSSDSISILVDDEIAIVGDAMFGVFRNSIFPPYADDIAKMVESWRKLLNTSFSLFLPGHGKEINRNLLKKEYDRLVLRFPRKIR